MGRSLTLRSLADRNLPLPTGVDSPRDFFHPPVSSVADGDASLGLERVQPPVDGVF